MKLKDLKLKVKMKKMDDNLNIFQTFWGKVCNFIKNNVKLLTINGNIE